MANSLTIIILVFIALAYVTATFTASSIARWDFPLPPIKRRIGCIDGLRGYLALSVLMHHFVIWTQVTRLGQGWAPPSVYFFNELGAGAVALFFMITGLVFYPRVLTGFQACSWPAIYTSRFFRIVPIVAVSVILVVSIIFVRTHNYPDSSFPGAVFKWISAWSEPPLLGYEDSGRLNAYVLWSLRYEWLFYLFLLPACAAGMDLLRVTRRQSWLLPVALLAVSIGSAFTGASFSKFMAMFAIGMLAFECQRREHIAAMLRTPGATIIAVVALSIGMTSFSHPYDWALPLFGFFFICVACGNSIWGVLRSRGALVLGECSFSVYVLHGIVLNLLFVNTDDLIKELSTNQLPILLPVIAVAVVILTSATYLLIERPAIYAGGRLAKRMSTFRLRNEAAKAESAL